MTAQLDPHQRRESIAQLGSEDLDVLVVGGGAVGAGAALDAVSRGLRVGLVERDDWGSGGSGHTSMLVNGSWRDVADPHPGELREALRERGLLLDWLAPHLVHRVPFLYPLYGGIGQRLAVGAEVLLYDAVAQSATVGRPLPAHRHLGRRSVRRLVPALRGDTVTGGVQFYDAQTDDARLVVTVVRTASAYGAAVANRVEVTGLLRAGGRVRGVRIRDRQSGEELEVSARVVVLATGHETQLQDASSEPVSALVSPERRRVHVVVPRSLIRSSTGIVVPGEGRGLIRITPWRRHWLVGPVQADAEPQEGGWPRAAEADIERLLAAVNAYLATRLTREQIQGCYAGIVIGRSSLRTGRVAPGLVVAGIVRLSTYRRVASQTVDVAVAELGGLMAPSITERLPLLGADGYHARWNQRHLLARRAGLHVARVEHLLNRYGSAADDLLQLVSAQPDLGRPLPGAEDYLPVELGYAASHEGASTLVDILARRTRIAIDTGDGGAGVAAKAAEIAGAQLGWSSAVRDRQLADYRTWLSRERRALTGPGEGQDGPGTTYAECDE